MTGKKNLELPEYKTKSKSIFLDQRQLYGDVNSKNGRNSKLYKLIKEKMTPNIDSFISVAPVGFGINIRDVNNYEDVMNYFGEGESKDYTIKVEMVEDSKKNPLMLLGIITALVIPVYKKINFKIKIDIIDKSGKSIKSANLDESYKEWFWLFYIPGVTGFGLESGSNYRDELIYEKLSNMAQEAQI